MLKSDCYQLLVEIMSNNLFSSELLLGIFQIFSEYTCIYCCCLGTKSCLTLCDPMDYSPPASPGPWNSPGKNIGVGCHF